MSNNTSDVFSDWERLTILELYGEYSNILRERRLKLRPATLEITDAASFWGKWDPVSRTIFMTRKLLREHSWFHVLAVLRHEIAHQYVDETLGGESGAPHGGKFQEACQKLGVPPEFSRAAVHFEQNSLDWRESQVDEASEKMLEKVRKLLNLASSSNEHEAVLAMNKVRELYAKYNLEQVSAQPEYFHLIIATGKKRLTTPEQKIVGILVGHFFVQVIVGRNFDVKSGEHHRSVEIVGTRQNVLMAEYVYHFLLRQAKNLVEELAKQKKLSLYSRRAYHLGILEGFDEKLTKNPQDDAGARMISKALEIFRGDDRLEGYVSQIYPRLVSLSSRARLRDGSAFAAGKQAGHRMNLNKPIQSRTSGPAKLLSGK